jgi:acetyl esterase/lipase
VHHPDADTFNWRWDIIPFAKRNVPSRYVVHNIIQDEALVGCKITLESLGAPMLLTILTLCLVPARSVVVEAPAIEVIRNLAYVEGSAADPKKHLLDLYLPPGRKDFPLLVFVHGGGWSHGDKNFWFDLYGKIGRSFAGEGIGVAVINYRLAPKTKHPDQAHDVAQAIRWLHKNIAKYGGVAEKLYLAGHSAGGHLVSLVASDEKYLTTAGLTRSAVKGVISISGVYDVQPDILLFDMVFGKETEVRIKASPITHVQPGLPPFLIVHGDHELPQCDGPCASCFYEKLKANQVECKLLPIAHRDHMSIVARISEANDPGQQAILQFIRTAKP